MGETTYKSNKEAEKAGYLNKKAAAEYVGMNPRTLDRKTVEIWKQENERGVPEEQRTIPSGDIKRGIVRSAREDAVYLKKELLEKLFDVDPGLSAEIIQDYDPMEESRGGGPFQTHHSPREEAGESSSQDSLDGLGLNNLNPQTDRQIIRVTGALSTALDEDLPEGWEGVIEGVNKAVAKLHQSIGRMDADNERIEYLTGLTKEQSAEIKRKEEALSSKEQEVREARDLVAETNKDLAVLNKDLTYQEENLAQAESEKKQARSTTFLSLASLIFMMAFIVVAVNRCTSADEKSRDLLAQNKIAESEAALKQTQLKDLQDELARVREQYKEKDLLLNKAQGEINNSSKALLQAERLANEKELAILQLKKEIEDLQNNAKESPASDPGLMGTPGTSTEDSALKRRY